MTTSNNQLPVNLQPVGDICIPVSVPNDTEWLWLLVKCAAFPSATRFWKHGNEADTETMRHEWDSRVYNPLVEAILNREFCAEREIDNCLEYNSAYPALEYSPQNPHTQPSLVPDNYIAPPFVKFGSLTPEFLPDWLEGWLDDFATEMTGYEENDVLLFPTSFPVLSGWLDLLGATNLPAIEINFSGVGIVQLRLLMLPFGGKAIVAVDTEPDIGDIIGGLFDGNIRSIELERDITSIPIETDIDHIEEMVFTVDEPHTIKIIFIPTVDDSLVPLKFGGGIRSITFCGAFAFEEVIPTECDIPTIIADDTFFDEEYAPMIFGEYMTDTKANEAAKAILYDGNAQSIGEDIPTGVPNGIEKNALCAAINRFVSLYASTKVCLIQSKNFIEIAWNNLAGAINEFYEFGANLMSPIYSPNLFSCFVSDAAAIIALQDAAAMEELACFLYDELKTVTMTQANFDAAILDAATTLTGTAQEIACVMNNDNNLSLYINMLEAYNITLQSSEADCPCEASSYWLWYMDFRTGNRHGTTTVNWNGNNNDGSWGGDGYYYNTPASPITSLNVAIGLPFLGSDYVIRAFASVSDRLGSNNDNGNDFASARFYTGESYTGTNPTTYPQGAIPDGDNGLYGGISAFNSSLVKSFQLQSRVLQRTDTPPHKLRVHQIIFWGLAHLTTGEKPAQAQWAGSTLPVTLAGLFP